jgi:ribose-phosphate pyrophosphokinase
MDKANIYICSESFLKIKSVERIVEVLSSTHQTTYELISKNIDYNTYEQPINDGTFFACHKRVLSMEEHLKESGILMDDKDLIISLENGVFFNTYQDFQESSVVRDMCVIEVYDGKRSIQYTSFGIQIDTRLFSMYMKGFDSQNKSKNMRIMGRHDESFGKFLQRSFGVPHNNWMKDPRFGSCDRSDQIDDCCNKFLLDFCTDKIPDFPRKGVLFQDITSIMTHPQLLNILYNLLEKFITRNYDLDQIDFFAGLDARGFYFAPILAKTFGKGFIPIRKSKNVPHTGDINVVTQKYGTEYSSDSFGLTARPDRYKGKKVLILDDLLATGGSLIAAKSVLEQAFLNVVGAVTIYDVDALLLRADRDLEFNGLHCKVLVRPGDSDLCKLKYKMSDITLEGLYATPVNTRKYTMTSEEWLKGSETCGMKDIKLLYTAKDIELSKKLLWVMRREFGVDFGVDSFEPNISSGLFSNGEIRMDITTNVRNKHVVVVSQARPGTVNSDLMELFMILDALQRAGSYAITVILPYYPYSRSDKKDSPRCAIGAAVIANIFEQLGVDNLISIDLHAGQLQGLIKKGFHNLYIKNYMSEFIHTNYLRYHEPNTWNDKFILISPDAGAAKAVKSYSKTLGINNIILDKQRDYSKPSVVLKSRIIGDKNEFEGKTGLIIDDIGDTMGTMCSAAKELVDRGMKDVVIFVTHGILSGQAIDRINSTSYIKEVVVTDTLPQEDNLRSSPKIRVLSIDELIVRTIDGIITGRSISRLFT